MNYTFPFITTNIWQIEVVEFLSSHRRFRILWLEFGATLFEYLCKQKGYKPKELIERGKKGESIEKECAELLMELGEMRAKWWWPCSFKIKDIEISEEEAKRVKEYNDYNLFPSLFYGLYTSVILHQFCSEVRKHVSNYIDLGGEMLNSFNCIKQKLQVKQKSTEPETGLKKREKSALRRILKVESEAETLREALESLNLGWLLLHLDESAKGIRDKNKSKEEHNEYFNSLIRDVKRMSLVLHPDKTKQQGSKGQVCINNAIEGLKKAHSYIMEEYGYIKCYGVYRIYGEIPLNELISGNDIFKTIGVSAFSGIHPILSKLSFLARSEEAAVLDYRNEYLQQEKNTAKVIEEGINVLKSMKEEKIESFANKVKENIRKREKEKKGWYVWFYKSLDLDFEFEGKGKEGIQKSVDIYMKVLKCGYDKDYAYRYDHDWIEDIRVLLEECKEDKTKTLRNLEGEVEKLLKESEEQHKMLLGGRSKIGANEVLVQTVLMYKEFTFMYYKFFLELMKLPQEEVESIVGKIDSNFVQESKIRIAKLSEIELLEVMRNIYEEAKTTHVQRFKAYFIKQEGPEEKQKRIIEDFSNWSGDDIQIRHVILYALKLLGERLDKRFQHKETAEERYNREMEERAQINEQLKQEKEQYRQEKEQYRQEIEQYRQEKEQYRQEIEQYRQEKEQIKQSANMFEVKDRVRKSFFKLLRSAKFSEELQNIIEVCEEKIINKVVKFCIENNDISPEAVVREVMEEIKFNKEQIIREDEISEELVNRGISTLLDEINVSQAKASGIGK